MVIVGNPAFQDLSVFGAGVKKELLDLVAADIAENAAVFRFFKKPFGAGGGAEPMRAHADGLDHPADGALFNELPCENGVFHMKPFAVIYHIFPPCFPDFLLCQLQLFQGGEGSFVGKIILPRVHNP